jgi:hypothetical protein
MLTLTPPMVQVGGVIIFIMPKAAVDPKTSAVNLITISAVS